MLFWSPWQAVTSLLLGERMPLLPTKPLTIGRVLSLLARTPPPRAIDPKTGIKRTDDPDLEFRASWRAFATRRAALLAILEPLPPEGWSCAATVTGAGEGLARTVLSYRQRLARHERSHLKQIERIVGGIPGSGP